MSAFRPYISNTPNAKTGQKEHGFSWLCPGCGENHYIPTSGHSVTNWAWDGDEEKPTFSPSVRVRHGHEPQETCHFFVKAGIAEFCGDCTHEHAGKKLPVLPDPDRKQ